MIVRLPKPERRARKPRKRIPRRKALRRMPAALSAHRQAEKDADDCWRFVVYARNGFGMCQRCRVRPGREAHHLVSRTKPATRWIPENGAHLCRYCHATVGELSEENRALAIRLVGLERWEQLNVTANCRMKTDAKLMAVVLWQELKRRNLTHLLEKTR